MYAVFWVAENGTKGNGEYILTEGALRAWLSHMRSKYPEMTHWGQSVDGERYNETPLTRSDVQ